MADDEKQTSQKKHRKIGPGHVIVLGLLLAVTGAIFAFALDEPDTGTLDIEALGGILLATGAVLAAGAGIAGIGGDGGGSGGTGLAEPANLKSIVGLIAVVSGITAVAALTVVTVASLGSKDTDSMVAITSSAFGVISAVVSAYLGIKITAETSAKATDEVKQAAGEAAVAVHEADKVQQKLSALSATVDDKLPPGQANEIKATAATKVDEADPPAS